MSSSLKPKYLPLWVECNQPMGGIKNHCFKTEINKKFKARLSLPVFKYKLNIFADSNQKPNQNKAILIRYLLLYKKAYRVLKNCEQPFKLRFCEMNAW